MEMLVLVMDLRLRAPWCHSLKDKRSEVRRMVAGLRGTFNVSVCEAEEQDIHQIIRLSVAALAFNHAQADSIAQRLADYVQGNTQAELVEVTRECR